MIDRLNGAAGGGIGIQHVAMGDADTKEKRDAILAKLKAAGAPEGLIKKLSMISEMMEAEA